MALPALGANPATISAGAKLLGAVGGLFGGGKSKAPSLQDQFDYQKSIWNYEVPMRVASAKAAGIHPLYALGASTSSFAPTIVGNDGGNEWSSKLNEMGQGVSRAFQAYQSAEDRDIMKKSTALDLENKQLQNDKLRSEISLTTQAGTAPAMARSPFMAGQQVPDKLFDTLKDARGNDVFVYSEAGAQQMEPMTVTNLYHDTTKALPSSVRADLRNRWQDVKTGFKNSSWSNKKRWLTKDYWLFKD